MTVLQIGRLAFTVNDGSRRTCGIHQLDTTTGRCAGCDQEAAMTTSTIPEGSTPERHAIETARIAHVFGLTGGELAEEAWTTTDSDGRRWVSHWWYEGAPEYVSRSELRDGYEHRTMVRDITFGEPAVHLADGWELGAVYRSSGETECEHEAGAGLADCQLCEGDGFVYIGDGWAEVVYQRPEAGTEATELPSRSVVRMKYPRKGWAVIEETVAGGRRMVSTICRTKAEAVGVLDHIEAEEAGR